MKKMHVADLSDGELKAVFQAAAKDAVDRVCARGERVPSLSMAQGAEQAKQDAKHPNDDRPAPARTRRKKLVA